MIEKDKDMKKKLEKIIENPRLAASKLTETEKLEILPFLKKESRNKYLEKRVLKQLELFERILKDRKELFKDQELTAEERRKNELDEKILKYA